LWQNFPIWQKEKKKRKEKKKALQKPQINFLGKKSTKFIGFQRILFLEFIGFR
jgi:hypothetical protein